MQDKFRPGAALARTQQRLGGTVLEKSKSVSVGSTSVAQLVEDNPDRVGLIIINTSAADLYINLDSVASTSFGILLGANGGNLSLTIDEDFTIITRVWGGLSASGAGNSISVFEYVRFSY